MLHLVGVNTDKDRVNYGVENGALTPIMRGVYVDAGDDADAILFAHALRLAVYLYPNTYLSGASAEQLGPTQDGRLFLCGRRAQRGRLRNLEIIQTRAPGRPSIETTTIRDSLGEFSIKRATPAFRFLESFRSRSEAGMAIDINLKAAMVERLIEEAGDQGQLARSLWRLAEANGWRTEAGKAERFLQTPLRKSDKNELHLFVGWHGDVIGVLIHDGAGWRWRPEDGARPTPVRTGAPGALPPFIESLLPEGWLEKVINPKSDRERLSKGKRYMSNIIVSADPNEFNAIPADILQGRLAEWSEGDRFTGRYKGPQPEFDATLEDRFAAMFSNERTPRLSGVQIKAPMTLSAAGDLTGAGDTAFTHILKPSPGAGFEALPLIEHTCLTAARACGFDTADHALIAMPDSLPDALLIERFDIRKSSRDQRRLAMEDMTSIRGVPATDKYEGSIEQVARALRPVSTNPNSDILILLKRALFAWLIADGDMHLKNMAVVRIAQPGNDNFTSVRLAPVYDAVTTRVFPNLENDLMALTLNGKQNRLTRRDLRRAAATMNLAVGEADVTIDETLTAFNRHMQSIAAPENTKLAQALTIWRERYDAFDD